MQILVARDRSDPTVTPQANSNAPNTELVTEEQMNSEMALLQGDDVLRQVVDNCGLYLKPGLLDFLLPRDPERRKAIKVAKEAKRLAKALDVEVEKRANVIDVTYGKTGAPETPACVLDNLSRLYLQKHLQLRRPSGSFDFFTQQTEEYRRALSNAEEQLSDFGQDEGVVAPDVQRTLTAQKLVDAMAALDQTRQAIAQDQERIHNLEAQLSDNPARSRTQEHTDSAGQLIQQLQSSLLASQLKRTQLLLKYDLSYPLVQEVEQEIALTKTAIADAEKMQIRGITTDRDPGYELLRADLLKTKTDLAAQSAGAAAAQQNIKRLREYTVQLDQKAVKQQALLREHKAVESNYLLYLAKREDARASDALDSHRIDNVAVSVPPTVPLLPATSPFMVVFLGFFLAIFVSAATAFAVDYLEPSFRTPAEVIEILNIPVVTSIPSQAA
jgi:uncharacterized protein involved in exopolysaccharide biosynthesis